VTGTDVGRAGQGGQPAPRGRADRWKRSRYPCTAVRAPTLITERGRRFGGRHAKSRLLETVRLGVAVCRSAPRGRRGWLRNRLPARVRLASDRCTCPVGPRRGMAQKRDERPGQIRYKACPPRPVQSPSGPGHGAARPPKRSARHITPACLTSAWPYRSLARRFRGSQPPSRGPGEGKPRARPGGYPARGPFRGVIRYYYAHTAGHAKRSRVAPGLEGASYCLPDTAGPPWAPSPRAAGVSGAQPGVRPDHGVAGQRIRIHPHRKE
jgi:hypothetical protein